MLRTIIFGTGTYLKKRVGILPKEFNILAFADNNSSLWGQDFFGKKIISPDVILKFTYDIIIIAVSNKFFEEINNQLISLGIPASKIYSFEFITAMKKQGEIQYYGTNVHNFSADVLIISNELNYSGAPMACISAALVLKKNNKKVCIAAPSANLRLVREINEKGIVVVVAPALNFPGKKELLLAKNCDFVLVNVYTNISAACEFSKIKPVLWWVHETNDVIHITNIIYHCNIIKPSFTGIHTVAVCKNVKENLNSVWPDLPVTIMNYGLLDFYNTKIKDKSKYYKINFAIIATIYTLKAQDVFVKAALEYFKICNVPAEFWVIGSGSKSEFFDEVMELSNKNPNIIWKGEMSREELESIYPQIDVVVCPSRHEGLPIAVNEGLMNAKVCIVADTAGDNDYIVDGESGFFFHGEDVDELAEKMKYVAENYNNLGEMRNKARQVYIDHYSMDSFANRLSNEIKFTVENWQPNLQNSDFLSEFLNPYL